MDSAKETKRPTILLSGSKAFCRRLFAALHLENFHADKVKMSSPTERKAITLSEKPELLVIEISRKTSKEDIEWIREELNEIRDRLKGSVYIVLALTSSETFTLAGSLILSSTNAKLSSGLINDLLIIPPSALPNTPSLEEQIINCAQRLAECKSILFKGSPALYDSSWVPSISDSHSRELWLRWVPRYAKYNSENPLIVGPTGSGKTRVAKALHMLSEREGPFISITPRDFSSSELVQAELFGSSSGAFTGAVDKWGLVKKAEKGTLFIDELQSIDFDLQGKLITFIEDKKYRRVGESSSNDADVRFIFATNRSLQDLVNTNRLRDDFAYRLERLKINLLPISDRKLDILAAIAFSSAKIILERANNNSEPAIKGFTKNALQTLLSETWPGNLRQVENTIARSIDIATTQNLTHVDEHCCELAINNMLGRSELTTYGIFQKAAQSVAINSQENAISTLEEFTLTMQRTIRGKALEATGGDVEKAAELIGETLERMSHFATSNSND